MSGPTEPPFQSGFVSEVLVAKTAREFLGDGQIVIEYVVSDMLRRGYLYALTARTGHGKTGAALLIAICVCSGIPFGPNECDQRPVLFIAAENAEDVRIRLRAQLDVMAITMGEHGAAWRDHVLDKLMVLDKSFLLADKQVFLETEIAKHGSQLVIVDTDSAVSVSSLSSDNDNGARMDHARRLRALTRLPTLPTVLDLCHPAGTGSSAELVPRGGSAFLNEIDGNPCLKREAEVMTLWSHAEKFRGMPFELTLHSELIESQMVIDTKGRRTKVPVVSVPTAERAALAEVSQRNLLNETLRVLAERPGATNAEIQAELKLGAKQRYTVTRVLQKMREQKLVDSTNVLTSKGKKVGAELVAAGATNGV